MLRVIGFERVVGEQGVVQLSPGAAAENEMILSLAKTIPSQQSTTLRLVWLFVGLTGTLCLSGCQSRVGDANKQKQWQREQLAEAAKQATDMARQVEDVPGSFYLTYHMTGSNTGGIPQLLVIATDREAFELWRDVQPTPRVGLHA